MNQDHDPDLNTENTETKPVSDLAMFGVLTLIFISHVLLIGAIIFAVFALAEIFSLFR